MATVSRTATAGKAATGSKPVLVALLLVAFVIPVHFEIAGLKLSLYRAILLVMLFPAMFSVFSGAAGRVKAIDYLILGFAFWASLALAANHGLAAKWQTMGFISIETLGSYFIARWMIRDLSSMKFFSAWYLAVVIAMLPFAIYQNLYDVAPLIDITQSVMKVYKTVHHEPRLGMYRGQGAMPHPILYGVFCAGALSLTWYVLGAGKGLAYKLPRAALVVGAVFTSVSSGAYLAVVVQIALATWRQVFGFMQARWRLLGGLFIGMYLFIEVFSSRSPAQIFARYLAIKASTAWNRIYIFEYAKDDIMRSPLFGIGMKDWTRPNWLLPSVDNFWLVMAMRYGLPGFLLLLTAVIYLYRQAGKNQLTGELASVRLGYLFTLSGISVALITVHIWDATYSMFLFLIGSGVWLIDAKEEETTAPEPKRDKQIRYTRFAHGAGGAPPMQHSRRVGPDRSA